MVDVSGKPETERRAVAEGSVRLSPRALRLVRANAIAKGDVLATARLAGIQAREAHRRPDPALPPAAARRACDVDARARRARARSASRAEVRGARPHRASRWRRSPPSRSRRWPSTTW